MYIASVLDSARSLLQYTVEQASHVNWQSASLLLGGAYLIGKAVQFIRADADNATSTAAKCLPRDAFAGKTALIVGASSGIGEALALELASRKATVILCARRVERLQAVAEACRSLGAPAAYVVAVDVEAQETHGAFAEQVSRLAPEGLHYVALNSGRSQRGLIEQTPIEVIEAMFRLNVFGILSINKALLPLVIKGRGLVCTTSSVAGKTGSPCSAAYSATKGAVNMFFDAMRMELADKGVRVLNVCPGPVHSEITLHAFTDTPGEEFGKPADDINRMTAKRCAHLMAGAMWAGLTESWVSPQPILAFTYVNQYMPTLGHYLAGIIGPKRVAAFRRGHMGYDALQAGALLRSSLPQAGGGAKQH